MFQVALQRLSADGVVAIAPEELPGLTEQVRVTADPKFGDYSGTMAMALAKRAGRKPRDMAAEIISRLDVGELFDPPGEPVGPGFINLRVSDVALARVHELDRIDDQRGRHATAAGERVGLLEQGAPEPLAAHAGIEVGGELEGLGPAVPRAGGVVRRASEAEEISSHVGSGPGIETNDLANRIGARPMGGQPIMIRAASMNVKRWA